MCDFIWNPKRIQNGFYFIIIIISPKLVSHTAICCAVLMPRKLPMFIKKKFTDSWHLINLIGPYHHHRRRYWFVAVICMKRLARQQRLNGTHIAR